MVLFVESKVQLHRISLWRVAGCGDLVACSGDPQCFHFWGKTIIIFFFFFLVLTGGHGAPEGVASLRDGH